MGTTAGAEALACMIMENSTAPHQVGKASQALGYAGLLPQAAAVAIQIWAHATSDWHGPIAAAAATMSALFYGAVILSFLGGIWWGLAMRRTEGQAWLAALAVVPSLCAAGFFAAAPVVGLRWILVALGSAILLTLLVDRRLTVSGEAPEGWMRLRIPLSAWLGALTILAGVLATR